MKKTLLFALLAIAGTGFAQEQITGYYGYINDDIATTDGTGHRNYNRVVPDGIINQSAGPNQTWNFLMTPIGTSDYHNILPSEADMGTYPGTTRVVENTTTISGNTTVSHALLNGWSLTGVENVDFTLNYEDNGSFSPDMVLEYGDNYSESIGGSFTYDGYVGTFTGTITGTVDAYGTLNLDAGFGPTSDPVTRLKIVQALTLQYPPFGNVGTTEITSYHYYRQGDLYPYFSSTLSYFNIPLLSIDETQTVMEAANPAVLGTAEFNPSRISIAPNPASGIISVIADNLTIQSISIVDMNGRTVLTSAAGSSIDISSLSSGVYFAKINTDSGSLTRKIIKQ